MYATAISSLLQNYFMNSRLQSLQTPTSSKSKIDMSQLPTELLIQIFKNLDAKTLGDAQGTCRRFNHVITSHRDQMELSRIGELDIVVKSEDHIEYLKNTWINTGTIQVRKSFKYQGGNLNMEYIVVDKLSLILYELTEKAVTALNIPKIKAKNVYLKLNFNESPESLLVLHQLITQITSNEINQTLRISFMHQYSESLFCNLNDLYCSHDKIKLPM